MSGLDLGGEQDIEAAQAAALHANQSEDEAEEDEEDDESEDASFEDAGEDEATSDIAVRQERVAPAPIADEETVAWSRLAFKAEHRWVLPATPLGESSLHREGPNGPPMNIMDFCPVSDRIFVVNQRDVFGLPLERLAKLATSPEEVEAEPWPKPLRIGAPANRVKCGEVAGQPVMVTADGQGGVLLVPTCEPELRVALALLNRHHVSGHNVSTWGVGLERHGAGRLSGRSSGEVAVSANDHRVKAWTLTPPAAFEPMARHSISSVGQPQWCYAQLHPTAQQRHQAPQDDLIDGRPTASINASGSASRVVMIHDGNVPSVDLSAGVAISASLDGSLMVAEVPRTVTSEAGKADPAVHLDASQGNGDEDAQRSLAEAMRQQLMQQLARMHAEHSEAPPSRRFACPDKNGDPDFVWNVCWVPLPCIRVLRRPCFVVPSSPVTDRLGWRTSGGPGISGDLVASWVLPFLTADELFSNVQAVSEAHADAVLQQVRCVRRPEQYILCFSVTTVWLLSADFKVLCCEALPFDATFAHVHFSPELSSAIVGTKYERSAQEIWAITVLRRRRSLRFGLQISPVRAEPQAIPRYEVIGAGSQLVNGVYEYSRKSRGDALWIFKDNHLYYDANPTWASDIGSTWRIASENGDKDMYYCVSVDAFTPPAYGWMSWKGVGQMLAPTVTFARVIEPQGRLLGTTVTKRGQLLALRGTRRLTCAQLSLESLDQSEDWLLEE